MSVPTRILATGMVGVDITVGALLVVPSTVQRADDANRQVLHTPEVLAALEQTLASAQARVCK